MPPQKGRQYPAMKEWAQRRFASRRAAVRAALIEHERSTTIDVARMLGSSVNLVRDVRAELVAAGVIHDYRARGMHGLPAKHHPDCPKCAAQRRAQAIAALRAARACKVRACPWFGQTCPEHRPSERGPSRVPAWRADLDRRVAELGGWAEVSRQSREATQAEYARWARAADR